MSAKNIEKEFIDEDWSQTSYYNKPVWQEVESNIARIQASTIDQPDFSVLSAKDHANAVRRQIMLAVWDNLENRFHPNDERLIELTRSRQSHWNFMLLGALNGQKRVEQAVTDYFLVKLAHRLSLHGITINWPEIEESLKSGSRWKLLTSPSAAEPRERWMKKYGENPYPDIDYPAPWTISNEFSFRSDTKQLIWPCKVQNDGVFWIPKEGFKPDDQGRVIGKWVLLGVEPPSTEKLSEADKANTTRLVDLLTDCTRKLAEAQFELAAAKQRIEELEGENRDLQFNMAALEETHRRPIRFELELDPLTGEVVRTG